MFLHGVALFLRAARKKNDRGDLMRLFGIGLLAFCTSFALTPIAEALSWRIGAVDVPKDGRRMHHRSIARAGGISIFVSFLLCCFLLPVRSAHGAAPAGFVRSHIRSFFPVFPLRNT